MTEVLVSRSAIERNFRTVSRLVGGPQHVLPIIKGNAYGHGSELVAHVLAPLKPWGFGLATSAEALQLRHARRRERLLIFSSWEGGEVAQLAKSNTHVAVWDRASAKVLSALGRRAGHRIPIHAKIDTGTSRLGVLADDAPAFLRWLQELPGVRLVGAFSHFADAEAARLSFTNQQLRVFREATFGVSNIVRHIACTAAALRLPGSRMDFIRLGIGLYGLWPSIATRRGARVTLRPALTWQTRVEQIKALPAGTSVGYGRSFTLARRATIAVLPVGYADGLDRALSNRGQVLVSGRRCPIIGRVCMNITMALVPPRTRVGAVVTLVGGQGRRRLEAEAVAERAGTIHYELLTRIAEHVPRRLIA